MERYWKRNAALQRMWNSLEEVRHRVRCVSICALQAGARQQGVQAVQGRNARLQAVTPLVSADVMAHIASVFNLEISCF